MKIVAIGGGEIGRPGFPIETEKIDRRIIRLSGKIHPRLLFIPTASSDSEGYVRVIKNYFGKRLGCSVSTLFLLRKKISRAEIRRQITRTDIVYVGGGNTLAMMTRWRKFGVDVLLRKAAQQGIVLAGVSAGAVCWFRQANSDSRKFNNPHAGYIKVRGIGLIPALCCPHYNVERGRQAALKKMMKKTPGVAIALDNCAALEVVDGTYRIITSKPEASGYKVFWKKGKLHAQKIRNGEILELK